MQCSATRSAGKLPHSAQASASWCTADPGPPRTPSCTRAELLAVPGLQRTTLGSALRAAPGSAALRPGHMRRFAIGRDLTVAVAHGSMQAKPREKAMMALRRSWLLVSATLVLAGLATTPAGAQSVADFYRGKTVNVLIGVG